MKGLLNMENIIETILGVATTIALAFVLIAGYITFGQLVGAGLIVLMIMYVIEKIQDAKKGEKVDTES